MGVRAKQSLAVIAGCLVAMVMVMLGLWQMRSYEESTRDVSAERAAEAPVSLATSVSTDGGIADIYGHRVTLSGEFVPQHEVLVGTSSPLRVATLFRMDDGLYVTVVRGAVDPGATPPAPPEGHQRLEGIFLASDKPATEDRAAGADQPTLRLQSLVQEWPSPLVGGYVTLGADSPGASGMSAAPLELPKAEGSATHRGYALQWWVFAAGAVGIGIYGARGIGIDARAKQKAAASS